MVSFLSNSWCLIMKLLLASLLMILLFPLESGAAVKRDKSYVNCMKKIHNALISIHHHRHSALMNGAIQVDLNDLRDIEARTRELYEVQHRMASGEVTVTAEDCAMLASQASMVRSQAKSIKDTGSISVK